MKKIFTKKNNKKNNTNATNNKSKFINLFYAITENGLQMRCDMDEITSLPLKEVEEDIRKSYGNANVYYAQTAQGRLYAIAEL